MWHFGCKPGHKNKTVTACGSVWPLWVHVKLHFDNVSWQCLLACRPFNLCFNKQQIFGRFPRKQTWPAVECCSSSAVDLRFCWSVPRSGAGSGWSLLLFCQKSNEERTEEKTARLLCIPLRLRTSGVNRACEIRDQAPTRHRQWLCNEKPSRCWLGAVPRYWKGCCKLFPKMLVLLKTPLFP